MLYTIRHVTRFTYDTAIAESVMEARMQPRSESTQRCVHFGLSTTPSARVMMYQDHDGNIVHHFNIPGRHSRLTVTAEGLVEMSASAPVPESLDEGAWDRLDEMTATGEYWDVMNPSVFARSTSLLNELAAELPLMRTDDPLITLRQLTQEIYRRFEYRPESTRVDSPIDHALEARSGVCQDFAHIFITLARELGIPCRYVSGYLFRSADVDDRSLDGATHAWAEALLPELGWIGFDPTNNVMAGDRHIRVAVGRDYADVPPTRGVYKGVSAVKSELAVAVTIGTAQPSVLPDATPFIPWMSRDAAAPFVDSEASQQQQQ